MALVDASDDHAQAIDLFSQAVARLGARHASVYTERMHEGLELFVRTQGAWLLLGPLTDEQWEDYFSMMLPATQDRRSREAAERTDIGAQGGMILTSRPRARRVRFSGLSTKPPAVEAGNVRGA